MAAQWEIPFSREARCDARKNSRFFEISDVLVHFDHVARAIVNADHSVM
jgi:hypothetical protein